MVVFALFEEGFLALWITRLMNANPRGVADLQGFNVVKVTSVIIVPRWQTLFFMSSHLPHWILSSLSFHPRFSDEHTLYLIALMDVYLMAPLSVKCSTAAPRLWNSQSDHISLQTHESKWGFECVHACIRWPLSFEITEHFALLIDRHFGFDAVWFSLLQNE